MFNCLSIRFTVHSIITLLLVILLSINISAQNSLDDIPTELLSVAKVVHPVSNGLITEEEGELWLHWTATGDDFHSGRALGYDIRYRLAVYGPIDNDLKWRNAIEIANEPSPAASGQPDSMLITDMVPGESYYFCMKAYDDAGNYSGLSNSSLRTLPGAGLSLEISSTGSGYVQVVPEKDYYNHNEVVFLYARPDSGWGFSHWTGNINVVYNPILIYMSSSFSINAIFLSEGDYLAGDANRDGMVLPSDITFIIQYFRGEGPNPVPLLAGDSNADCYVTGSDITYMVRYFRSLGPPPQYGACDGPVLSIIDFPLETMSK